MIEKIRDGCELDAGDIRIAQLVSETVDDEQKVEFLGQLHRRGETAGEIVAFAKVLLDRATDPEIDLASLPGPVIDVCGTGGDGYDLLNVSTTIMFILAADGVVVLKHSNRRVTSACGSADVLEELGVDLALTPDDLRRCGEELHLGFIFARQYHPVFRALAATREHLARQNSRTVFTLSDHSSIRCARPRQLLGVYAPRLTSVFAEVPRELGGERAWVVHGLIENGRGSGRSFRRRPESDRATGRRRNHQPND